MRRFVPNFFIFLALAPAFSQTPPDRVIEIRVAHGETLGSIARTYLANPADWREIARANRLANPDLLAPGQVLIIPVRLLKETPGGGVVTFLKGAAEARAGEGALWTPLALGSRIAEGSAVRTKMASGLEITFDNGDTCFLRPETTVGLTSLRKTGGSFFYRIFLQAGKIVTRIRKATGAESRFEVRLPSAQCAARGTEFRASSGEDGMARFEILEGTVAVEAAAKAVDVGEGFGTAVRHGEPPLAPRRLLAAPRPSAVEPVYKSLPFAVAFERLPGAASLSAALTTDREGKDEAAGARLSPGESFRVADLPDGVYFLQARAFDDLGLEGLPSLPSEVRVRTRPRPPAVPAPADGFRRRAGAVSVSWPEAEGANRYRLQLADESGFRRLILDQYLGGTVWPGKLDPGTYYIRAASVAPDGFESAWSAVLSLAIGPALETPVLDEPDVRRKEVVLSWGSLGEGIVYRCQVSGNPNFEGLIHDSITKGAGLVLPKPSSPGTYFVRVGALDSQGAESPFSAAESFRVSRGLGAFLSPCILFALGVLVYLLT